MVHFNIRYSQQQEPGTQATSHFVCQHTRQPLRIGHTLVAIAAFTLLHRHYAQATPLTQGKGQIED